MNSLSKPVSSGAQRQSSKRQSALLLTVLVALSFSLLSSPIHAADPDEAKVKEYIKKQKAAGVKPKAGSPNWKKGYTCNDLKKQSFEEYQECRYYYAENGRFYPD